MGNFEKVTVLDSASRAIINNGSGTLAKTRLTVTGAWIAPPVRDATYKITSSNRSPVSGPPQDFQNNVATFKI